MMHNLRHRYTKETEGDKIYIIIIRMTFRQEIDHLVEIEGLWYTEVEKILVTIVDKIIEGDHEKMLEVSMEKTIILVKGIGIEVVVDTIIETITEIGPEMTIEEIVMLIEIEVGQDKQVPYLEGRTEEIIVDQHQGQDLGLDQV